MDLRIIWHVRLFALQLPVWGDWCFMFESRRSKWGNHADSATDYRGFHLELCKLADARYASCQNRWFCTLYLLDVYVHQCCRWLCYRMGNHYFLVPIGSYDHCHGNFRGALISQRNIELWQYGFIKNNRTSLTSS